MNTETIEALRKGWLRSDWRVGLHGYLTQVPAYHYYGEYPKRWLLADVTGTGSPFLWCNERAFDGSADLTEHMVPDLTDPLTFYGALAVLARRVGLDPSQGVFWVDEGDGNWSLVAPRLRPLETFHGINYVWFDAQNAPPVPDDVHVPIYRLATSTDDPHLALASALAATVPQ